MPTPEIEVMPEFPGGQAELMRYIKTSVRYPDYERVNNIVGICDVAFVIEADGSVSGVRVVKGIPGGYLCDSEAVRVVREMPKWKPGMIGDKGVRVQFNIPIKFTLKDEKLERARRELAAKHYKKAMKFYYKNKADKAIEEFTYALDVFGFDADMLLKRGEMYFKAGKKVEACRDWQRIKKTNNTIADEMINLNCNYLF